MLEHADSEDARERRVPGLGAGDVRSLGEPEGAAGEELEHGRAVKDGRELACADAVVAADSDGSPFGMTWWGGGMGGVQAAEDGEELRVQGFLEADYGGGDGAGVEAEGGEEAGEAGGPGGFAAEGGGGGVADVVGEDAEGGRG